MSLGSANSSSNEHADSFGIRCEAAGLRESLAGAGDRELFEAVGAANRLRVFVKIAGIEIVGATFLLRLRG